MTSGRIKLHSPFSKENLIQKPEEEGGKHRFPEVIDSVDRCRVISATETNLPTFVELSFSPRVDRNGGGKEERRKSNK